MLSSEGVVNKLTPVQRCVRYKVKAPDILRDDAKHDARIALIDGQSQQNFQCTHSTNIVANMELAVGDAEPFWDGVR